MPTEDSKLGKKLQALKELEEIIERLRGPNGCPWDRKQTLESLSPNFLEEAAEVVDAIQEAALYCTATAASAALGSPSPDSSTTAASAALCSPSPGSSATAASAAALQQAEGAEPASRGLNSSPEVREELGDLLMNIFLAARVAEEAGGFSLVEVANGISQKLVRRHPHVFGGEKIDKVPGVLSRWSALKAQEKAPANAPEGIAAPASESVLDGIPRSLPALEAAFELGRRAAKIGFDWPNAAAAIKKVYEEAAEIESCLAAPAPSRARLQYEIGDLLFAVVNVARKLGIAPEPALRQTMQKFRQRFHPVEERVRKSPPGAAPTLEEMERLWQQAKTSE